MNAHRINGIVMLIGSIIGNWAMFKVEGMYNFIVEKYSPWWFMRFGMFGFFFVALFVLFATGISESSNTE